VAVDRCFQIAGEMSVELPRAAEALPVGVLDQLLDFFPGLWAALHLGMGQIIQADLLFVPTTRTKTFSPSLLVLGG